MREYESLALVFAVLEVSHVKLDFSQLLVVVLAVQGNHQLGQLLFCWHLRLLVQVEDGVDLELLVELDDAILRIR